MDNFILEVPDSTDDTPRDVCKIMDSPEYHGIIELYNSSDWEIKRLGIELLKIFKHVAE